MEINITITAGIVAVIGAVISFICMIISWSQASNSRKNLKIQTELFEARKPNFRIKDVLESYATTEPENADIHIRMCPLIVNLSDRPLTIERIRLRIVGEAQTVILLPVKEDKCIIDGFNIPANNASAEWIRFDINKKLYHDLRIMKFVLSIEDVYDNSDDRTVICLKEVMDENE